jgi:hypothetical protein
MATATTRTDEPRAAPAPASGLRPYRMTVEVYERIAASGALGDKSPVFLWKGQLVEKVSDMTKGRPHVTAVNILGRLLGDLVRDRGYFVEQDQPIAFGGDNEPEPDLKCVRGTIQEYAGRTPSAEDCPLIVEVADASLADDTGEMLRAYAAALVSEYWVVNIPGRRVEVYTGPGRRAPDGSPGYASCRQYGPDDEVPVILDGHEVGRIAVHDVLF